MTKRGDRPKFTPEVLATMRRLSRRPQGATSKELAQVVGTTPNTIRVMCSRAGIALARRRAKRLGLTGAKMVGLVTQPTKRALMERAAAMGIAPELLVTLLLECVVAGDLFDAVLDA